MDRNGYDTVDVFTTGNFARPLLVGYGADRSPHASSH
jgi:hypothetical protein